MLERTLGSRRNLLRKEALPVHARTDGAECQRDEIVGLKD